MMILNAVQKKNKIKNTFKVHYDFLKKNNYVLFVEIKQY